MCRFGKQQNTKDQFIQVLGDVLEFNADRISNTRLQIYLFDSKNFATKFKVFTVQFLVFLSCAVRKPDTEFEFYTSDILGPRISNNQIVRRRWIRFRYFNFMFKIVVPGERGVTYFQMSLYTTHNAITNSEFVFNGELKKDMAGVRLKIQILCPSLLRSFIMKISISQGHYS